MKPVVREKKRHGIKRLNTILGILSLLAFIITIFFSYAFNVEERSSIQSRLTIDEISAMYPEIDFTRFEDANPEPFAFVEVGDSDLKVSQQKNKMILSNGPRSETFYHRYFVGTVDESQSIITFYNSEKIEIHFDIWRVKDVERLIGLEKKYNNISINGFIIFFLLYIASSIQRIMYRIKYGRVNSESKVRTKMRTSEKTDEKTDSSKELHSSPSADPLYPPFPAYKGEQPYIFISYSHRDTKEIFTIIENWHSGGYNIWYDEGIDPGNEWPEEIAQALAGCSQFVVFISPSAVASKNVRNEINYALNHSKDFLAIHLEDTQLPKGMELQMGSIQAIMRYRMTPESFNLKLQKVL